MAQEKILIIDDEQSICGTLKDILEDEGFSVTTAVNAELARAALKATEFDLILLDIWMPDVDGITLLKEIRRQDIACPIVMISGHGTVETAVDAIQHGAYDYLEKPLTTAKLLITINRALLSRSQEKQITNLKSKFEAVTRLVGSSDTIAQLRDKIKKIAQTRSWVMIQGGAGSGKSVVARALHCASARKDKPFVEVSLAAIPAQNIARRLFGSDESDAVQLGCFEQAEGGTLYLDEISDLDADTQAKLLSALQAGRFMRVSGKTPINMDVRIISSTNQPLETLVKENSFREDLFYRLNVMPIKVPPLYTHLDDIPALVEFYIDRFVQNEGLPYRELSSASTNRLRQHNWPGNVRELVNLVQQLLVMGGEPEISEAEINAVIGKRAPSSSSANSELPDSNYHMDYDLRTFRDSLEKAYFEHHLKTLGGNVSAVAKVSGLERTHLYRKLKGLNIDPKDWKN